LTFVIIYICTVHSTFECGRIIWHFYAVKCFVSRLICVCYVFFFNFHQTTPSQNIVLRTCTPMPRWRRRVSRGTPCNTTHAFLGYRRRCRIMILSFLFFRRFFFFFVPSPRSTTRFADRNTTTFKVIAFVKTTRLPGRNSAMQIRPPPFCTACIMVIHKRAVWHAATHDRILPSSHARHNKCIKL